MRSIRFIDVCSLCNGGQDDGYLKDSVSVKPLHTEYYKVMVKYPPGWRPQYLPTFDWLQKWEPVEVLLYTNLAVNLVVFSINAGNSGTSVTQGVAMGITYIAALSMLNGKPNTSVAPSGLISLPLLPGQRTHQCPLCTAFAWQWLMLLLLSQVDSSSAMLLLDTQVWFLTL